jgi:hypothetical protein
VTHDMLFLPFLHLHLHSKSLFLREWPLSEHHPHIARAAIHYILNRILFLTKAHPEKGRRSLATFTAKEARIYAVNIWADPGTEGEAMANSEKAMAEGLKYNIVPDFVYYVDVNDWNGCMNQGITSGRRRMGPSESTTRRT